MKRSTFVAAQAVSLLLALPLLAQPIVSGVSPSGLTHGQKGVVISGSKFGTKATAAPLIYDDFEDGIDSGWGYNWGPLSVNSDNLRHALSTKNVRGDFRDSYHLCFEKGPRSTKWYGTFWFKLSDNFVWPDPVSVPDTPLAQFKMFRLVGANNSYPHVYISLRAWEKSSYFAIELGKGFRIPLNPYNVTPGQWYHHEFAYEESTALDVEDGKGRYWFNGTLLASSDTMLTATTANPNREKSFLIGPGVGHWWGSPGYACYIYVDDAYVDNSWARVMFGDNSTWEQCTHREIQIPSAWSETAIEFTVNQGSFQTGLKAYLYVVDADGKVNAEGFPITFSTSEQPTAGVPGKPTPEGAMASSAR